MRTPGVIVLVALLYAPLAAADAIGPDWRPPTCPAVTCDPTTTPASSGSHSGCSPGCEPNGECTADAECASALGAGATCRPVRHCLAERFASRRGPVQVVVGTCDAAGACAEGTCSAVSRCASPPPAPAPPAPPAAEPPPAPAPPAAEPEPPDPAGAGCAVGPGSAPAGALALLFALAVRRARRM